LCEEKEEEEEEEEEEDLSASLILRQNSLFKTLGRNPCRRRFRR